MDEKGEEIVRTTLRVPRKLWDEVRHRAIKDHLSLQDLVIRALTEYVKKGGRA
jgi:predicted HicB family RNase H-like nuclease